MNIGVAIIDRAASFREIFAECLVEKTYKLVVSGLILVDCIMTKGIRNSFQMLIAVNVMTVARIGVESGRTTYRST